ncbi:MAG: hypothetical protein NTY19_52265, partial [Planctomycetota bacterium]|nr:hypothetical protein [Planctomycetota bacterium]
LGTELATIPAQVPYLSADPQLVGDWQDRLREIPGFRVGINWQGRPGPLPVPIASASTKPSLAPRNSAQAALAAAERTFQTSGALPFEASPARDPSQAGRERLKGAFTIAVERIRPDPKQLCRDFDAEELIVQLPTDEQPRLVEKIRSGHLSATETEREAGRLKHGRTGQAVRGVRSVVRR